MPFGVTAGYGIRRILDHYQNFQRSLNPVSLRIRNFGPIQSDLWAQLGFAISPTGTNQTGTTDILIAPQPTGGMVSTHNIGQSMGKLRFGARFFCISESFADQQRRLRNLTGTPDLVWRGPEVVGLVLDSQLFSIEDIAHEEWLGTTISWVLTCNSSEIPTTT